jgi:hypothetical protein
LLPCWVQTPALRVKTCRVISLAWLPQLDAGAKLTLRNHSGLFDDILKGDNLLTGLAVGLGTPLLVPLIYEAF